MSQVVKMELEDAVDGLAQEGQQDFAQFNITFKDMYKHPIASLLTKDGGFFEQSKAFVQALQLGPTAFPIIRELAEAKPPIYNALSKLISTWISKKGTEATFQKLLDGLNECSLEPSQENVGKWWVKKYPGKGVTPVGKVESKDAHDIALALSFDDGLQDGFGEFMACFALGADNEAAIRQAFQGRRMTSPFYDLVKKCLDTWCSRTAEPKRTWKTLLLILKDLKIAEAEKAFTEYFEDNVDEGKSGLR